MANRNAGNINRLIVTSGILHLWLYAKQSRNGFTRHTTQSVVRKIICGPKFFRSRSHDVIRVYDDAGNVIATREHKGDFKELVNAGLAIVQPFNATFRLWSEALLSRGLLLPCSPQSIWLSSSGTERRTRISRSHDGLRRICSCT